MRKGPKVLMEHHLEGPYSLDPRSLSMTVTIRMDVERMTGKLSIR